MDQAAEDRIRHEIEAEATRLFPGSVRRVEWLRYGDAPIIEPGELVPRFVLTEPRSGRGRPEPREALKAFQTDHGPAIKQFGHELGQRWPEIRHIGVAFEDGDGHGRGGMIQALNEHGPAQRDAVAVTVVLTAAERETADALITAGIASSRAGALRWALTHLRESGLPVFTGQRSCSPGRSAGGRSRWREAASRGPRTCCRPGRPARPGAARCP